jgi:hypothetical protein
MVEAIVLRLQKLGDLAESLDIGFGRYVDHISKGIMLGVPAQEASVWFVSEKEEFDPLPRCLPERVPAHSSSARPKHRFGPSPKDMRSGPASPDPSFRGDAQTLKRP